MFPGEQTETWTFDEQAHAWYFHRFYDFQPDLNWSNPAVRDEIRKVMAFWLQLGVSGFRIDAAPFVIEQTTPGVDPAPQGLHHPRLVAARDCSGRSATQCCCVRPTSRRASCRQFVGSRPDGPSDRAQMMFDFLLNPKAWLALARSDAEPLIEALKTAVRLPDGGQWATFLRNHDELDLSELTDEQRRDVFGAFAPRADMRLYGRGIRRRLAPMLKGERRTDRTCLRVAVLAARQPGDPLRRGDRHGGEPVPARPGRHPDTDAVGRRPQRRVLDRFRDGNWCAPSGSAVPTARKLVNVRAQNRDPNSLLRWFENLVHTLRTAPEIGLGVCTVVDVPLARSVLAHRFDAVTGSILLLHNLEDVSLTVDVGPLDGADAPYDLLVDGPYEAPDRTLSGLQLNGWGYRVDPARRAVITRDPG